MKKVISTILLIKICTFLLIICAYYLLPFSKPGYYFNFHLSQQISLQSAFTTWDAQHYLYLAQNGYKHITESDRFFPLLPSLIRTFSFLGEYFWGGMIIANIASFVGCIYFYLFVKNFSKNETVAYISLLLLLIFPTSFYFSLLYSESIFLLLISAAFYYLYEKKYLLSGLFALFLPLTRPTGIFILLPFFVYVLFDYYKAIKKTKDIFSSPLLFRSSLLLLLFPLMGLGIYFYLMYHTTGNAFTGFALQNNVVGRWQISAFLQPDVFLRNIFPAQFAIHGFTNSLFDRLFFLVFLISLPVIWKKTNPVLFSYALIMGIVPLFGSFMSYTRYMLLVLPIFIAYGKIFAEKQFSWKIILYAYPSLLLQALFIVLHSLNYWVA